MPVSRLEVTNKSGITVQDALKDNSIDITEENLMQLKYDPASVWGYVEVHLEQGPVLEWVGYPLGVVKGIAGQTRLKVTVKGTQGHAGTVPMSLRQNNHHGKDGASIAKRLSIAITSTKEEVQDDATGTALMSKSKVIELYQREAIFNHCGEWLSFSCILVTCTEEQRALSEVGV